MILDMRWRKENLITLCITCHDKVHRGVEGRGLIDEWMQEHRAEDYQFLRSHKPEQVKEYQLEEIYKKLKGDNNVFN